MEEGTNGPNGEGAPSATINTGGDVSPKTPRTERIPKKDVTEKKKLTAAERKKLAELKRREKEEDKKRKEKPESSTDEESTEALKKKIKFYQNKAETAEGEAYEALKDTERKKKCIKTNWQREKAKRPC